jgi:maltodextrin utilization protein YvdJ
MLLQELRRIVVKIRYVDEALHPLDADIAIPSVLAALVDLFCLDLILLYTVRIF